MDARQGMAGALLALFASFGLTVVAALVVAALVVSVDAGGCVGGL